MINFLRLANNIKLGDFLHQDGTINDAPSSDIIGICVISSNFLPDKYARFISLTQKTYYRPWGRDIRLKSDYKIRLPRKENGNLSLIDLYLPDDSFNPEFLKDLPGGNAFQDYKGYENMRLYKEKYGNDKTLSNAFTTIIKESPSYKKDDWYLPAIGELTLIIPKFDFIDEKLYKALIAGSWGITLPAGYIWSSTEHDSEDAWDVSLNYGLVDYGDKDLNDCVWAFLAL